MDSLSDTRVLAFGGLVGLAVFYYYRATRVLQVQQAATGPGKTVFSKGQQRQLTQSKYPYTTMSKRIGDPTVYSVTEGTWGREGEYGLERRDHKDTFGTATVTYTDNFNNL